MSGRPVDEHSEPSEAQALGRVSRMGVNQVVQGGLPTPPTGFSVGFRAGKSVLSPSIWG